MLFWWLLGKNVWLFLFRFIYDHRGVLVLVPLPVLFVAMYVGQHLYIKINDHLFNQVVSILLL